MKEFSRLVLCDWSNDNVEVHVSATLAGGRLSFAGQDLGPLVEEVWGDLDYEYWYYLDQENTEKLLAVIHGEEDPEAAVLREFSGEGGCRAMREICEKNGIEYRFNSYV